MLEHYEQLKTILYDHHTEKLYPTTLYLFIFLALQSRIKKKVIITPFCTIMSDRF